MRSDFSLNSDLEVLIDFQILGRGIQTFQKNYEVYDAPYFYLQVSKSSVPNTSPSQVRKKDLEGKELGKKNLWEKILTLAGNIPLRRTYEGGIGEKRLFSSAWKREGEGPVFGPFDRSKSEMIFVVLD